MCGLHVPVCGVSTGLGWACPRFPSEDSSVASVELALAFCCAEKCSVKWRQLLRAASTTISVMSCHRQNIKRG